MTLVELSRRGERLIQRAKHHGEGHIEGTMEAPDRIVKDPRLVGNRCCDPGMGKLQQKRAAGADKDRRFPIDPPGHRRRTEHALARTGCASANQLETPFKVGCGYGHRASFVDRAKGANRLAHAPYGRSGMFNPRSTAGRASARASQAGTWVRRSKSTSSRAP